METGGSGALSEEKDLAHFPSEERAHIGIGEGAETSSDWDYMKTLQGTILTIETT